MSFSFLGPFDLIENHRKFVGELALPPSAPPKNSEDFIVNNFLFGDDQDLTETTNFFDKGIVDSTGVLELICFMEETYDIKIEDDEVSQNNMSSIVNVNEFLKAKLKSKEK